MPSKSILANNGERVKNMCINPTSRLLDFCLRQADKDTKEAKKANGEDRPCLMSISMSHNPLLTPISIAA